MSQPIAPPCPRCGKPGAQLFSSNRPRDAQFHRLIAETIYVFTCQCGASFTHVVKDSPPGN